MPLVLLIEKRVGINRKSFGGFFNQIHFYFIIEKKNGNVENVGYFYDATIWIKFIYIYVIIIPRIGYEIIA